MFPGDLIHLFFYTLEEAPLASHNPLLTGRSQPNILTVSFPLEMPPFSWSEVSSLAWEKGARSQRRKV